MTDFAQDGILLQVGMGGCIGLFGAYSLTPPTTCPCGKFTWWHWRLLRTPSSLTLVSETTKHISLQWACNRHLSMVELPHAARQAGKTEPGISFTIVRVYVKVRSSRCRSDATAQTHMKRKSIVGLESKKSRHGGRNARIGWHTLKNKVNLLSLTSRVPFSTTRVFETLFFFELKE